MQSCLVRVWSAGALEPSPERFELEAPLPIGRELLGVSDSSVSRAANAPWLASLGPSAAKLDVPTRTANSVLVLHSATFETLSRGLGEAGRFVVGPAGLRRRWALVAGAHLSLALLRSLRPEPTRPEDHLISLPRAEHVPPGRELVVEAPAVLVIGNAAVSLLPGETRLPNALLDELPLPISFRLPTLGVSPAAARELDGFLAPELPRQLQLGGSEPCSATEFPNVARRVLATIQRPHAFVPALSDGHQPRLVLLYQRSSGNVRALLSDGDITEWVRDVDAALRAADRPRGLSVPVDPEPMESLRADDATLETQATGALAEPFCFGPVRTHDAEFAQVLERVANAAPGDLGLLLLGESGTGKEHLARAVHDASARAKGPFVAINCSAVPDGLIEGDLFGHKKGAFSGAEDARDGAFVSANGGTLLLDEIGDAPLRVQFALLRTLETRTVKPLGSDRETPVDVRVIAATSRDVRHLLQTERLREDLYFRIAELSVTLPPLRERLIDLPLIAGDILLGLRCTKPLTQTALAHLRRHPWPGNVRELRNALKRAIAQSGNAAVLNATYFGGLDPLARSLTKPTTPAPFDFPDVVHGVALHAQSDGSLPSFPAKSQHEQRALQRAALLYLLVTEPALAPGLASQWQRLFGPRWATSESGRGLKELLRTLGRPPTDSAAREWVLRSAGG